MVSGFFKNEEEAHGTYRENAHCRHPAGGGVCEQRKEAAVTDRSGAEAGHRPDGGVL